MRKNIMRFYFRFLCLVLVGSVLITHPVAAAPNVIARGNYWNGETYLSVEVPEDLDDAVSVAANWGHSLALRSNGNVIAWGSNFCGQTDIPAGLAEVVQIAAGDTHCLALVSNGSVVAWGGNDFGQTDVPAALDDVAAISAGDGHSLALRRNGEVVAWGWNGRGQIEVPGNLDNVVAIAAGGFHSLALRGDGVVFSWGGVPDFQRTYSPETWNDVIAIAAGTTHSLALRVGGRVEAWGENDFGQTDVPDEALTDVIAIAAGGHRSLALKSDGRLVMWGENHSALHAPNIPKDTSGLAIGKSHVLGLIGDGMPTSRNPIPDRIVAVGKPTSFYAQAVGAHPIAYQWQRNGVDIPGATDVALRIDSVNDGNAGTYTVRTQNASGATTSQPTTLIVGKRASLNVVEWGNYMPDAPSVPSDLDSAVAIAAGRSHSLALREDGTVVAWGIDFDATNVPPDLSDVIAVAAGEDHSMALKSDGTVVVWGYSSGFGPPTVPPDLADVVGISCSRHFLALRSDGTVAAWGDNSSGQIEVPGDLGDVVSVSAGFTDSLALKADGTVVGWGTTALPQGLTDVVAIGAGYHDGLALKEDGTVVAWGAKAHNVPDGLNDVVEIATGGFRSYALRSNGEMVSWVSSEPDRDRLPDTLVFDSNIGLNFDLSPDGEISITLDNSLEVPPGRFRAIAPSPNFTLALMGELPPRRSVTVRSLSHQDDVFRVIIPSHRSRVYRLDYKNSLDETEWKRLPLVRGGDAEMTLVDFGMSGIPMRFYRVGGW